MPKRSKPLSPEQRLAQAMAYAWADPPMPRDQVDEMIDGGAVAQARSMFTPWQQTRKRPDPPADRTMGEPEHEESQLEGDAFDSALDGIISQLPSMSRQQRAQLAEGVMDARVAADDYLQADDEGDAHDEQWATGLEESWASEETEAEEDPWA
jgi:hypothetical protein